MRTLSRILLHSIIWKIYLNYVQTSWPSTNSSTIDLLGLFPDGENTSEATTFSTHSRAMFEAAVLLSQRYNIKIDGNYIGRQILETGGDVMNCMKGTCRLLPNSSIVGIVGPAYSRETEVLAPFAGTLRLPMISNSATNTDLSDRNKYPSFFRTVPSDSYAALAMVSLFLQYNWTSCVVIYQNDAFGSGGARIISEAFANNGLDVDGMILFNINTLSFPQDFNSTLLSSPTRIVIVWADSVYINIILEEALAANVLGPQFTWILTSNMSIQSFNKTTQQKLIGLLTVEPVPGSIVNAPVNTTLLNAAYDLWQQYDPESFPRTTAIDYYAYFAFDAAWSLITALQQYCSTASNSSQACLSIADASFCFDRTINNGNELVDTITAVDFLGVTGQVRFSPNVTDRIDGIYYVAKNAQPVSDGIVTVPVLRWSGSNSWQPDASSNVILWPGNTLTPPTGIPSISGVRLRVALFLVDPYTMTKTVSDNSGTVHAQTVGYMPDLLQFLVENMGFIPEITIVPASQTYNSLIDAVVDNVYDVVVADVTVTAARSERVSFSNSIYDNSLRVIVRQNLIPSATLLAFLSPLSLQLWLVLFLAMIFASLLICLFERESNEEFQNRSIIGMIAMSIYYAFGNIVGYGAGFNAITSAGRLITVALYALSIVMVATYTANLASNLTVMKSQDVVSGVDDIKNGKISLSRVGIVVNSSIEAYYLREISNGIRNYYPLAASSEIFPKLLAKQIDAAIMDEGVLEYTTTNIYCNLTLVGTGVDKSSFGIVMQKNWLYAKTFDYAVLSLRESGVLNTLREKWFEGSICSATDSASDSTATSVDSLAGLFLVFAILLLGSFLLYVWETKHDMPNYLLRWVSKMKIFKRKKRLGVNHSSTKF